MGSVPCDVPRCYSDNVGTTEECAGEALVGAGAADGQASRAPVVVRPGKLSQADVVRGRIADGYSRACSIIVGTCCRSGNRDHG